EGFFKTGDIGKIDEEGFIYITDRKKEIIVTAGGKNIAPAPIENALKLSKYISNAYVYGDRKPYLVALVTMNIERVLEFAKENHLHYFDIGDLSKNEKMLDLFKSEIEEINKTLARYETIKKFSILPHDFSIEGGELTPTLKLKRRVIYKKYTDKIECLYTEDGNCFSC
ncbi:MAG: long-chain fatty acid--CoA ligase, partial [Desulfurella sp.]